MSEDVIFGFIAILIDFAIFVGVIVFIRKVIIRPLKQRYYKKRVDKFQRKINNFETPQPLQECFNALNEAKTNLVSKKVLALAYGDVAALAEISNLENEIRFLDELCKSLESCMIFRTISKRKFKKEVKRLHDSILLLQPRINLINPVFTARRSYQQTENQGSSNTENQYRQTRQSHHSAHQHANPKSSVEIDAERLYDCSTETQLRQLWIQLAKKYHPDNGGKQEDFILVKDAYERSREKIAC